MSSDVVIGVITMMLVVAALARAQLVEENVQRVVNMQRHAVSERIAVAVVNKGKMPVAEYRVAIETAKLERFALGRVAIGNGFKAPLVPNEKSSREGFVELVASVGEAASDGVAIAPGEKLELKVTLIFVRAFVPYPTFLKQGEVPEYRTYDSAIWGSPYPTMRQSTSFKVSGTRRELLSYTTLYDAAIESTGKLTYGPFDDIAPWARPSDYNVTIRVQRNAPFIVCPRVKKEVEVSHWGNVAVEESYQIMNSGPVLEGPFSRLDYEQGGAKQGSFHGLKAKLPAGSFDLYYRDRIGNISSSNARVEKDYVLLEIGLRYPLFGSWQTDFYFGYNLRSDQALYIGKSGHYVLQLNFGTPFDSMVINEYELHVVLPEGANDIKVFTQFPAKLGPAAVKKTYLDLSGRPVVVLTQPNVVSGYHKQPVQVSYSFSNVSIYWEPLLLVSMFVWFFAASVVYSRLDLSLAKQQGDVESEKSTKKD